MPKRVSLRRKLLAWLLVPLLLLWSVGAVVAYFMANNFANIAYDRSLLDSARSLAEQVKLVDNAAVIELPHTALTMLLSAENDEVFFKIVGRAGELVAGEALLPPPPTTAKPGIPLFHDAYLLGKAVRVASLYANLPGDATGRPVLVQIAETLNRRHFLAGEILASMIMPQLVLILLAALLIWFGVGRGLAPLGPLRKEIASRSHRDLRPVEEMDAPQEVGPIIHAINELMQRLRLALDAQQRFIADAAHQLRTPLAGLKTQIGLALDQQDPEQLQLALRQLNSSSERTIRLVNQMLALARMEPGASKIAALKALDLNLLVRDTAREWAPRAFRKNIDLGFEAAEAAVVVAGDELSLKMLLDNLIDNAIRYSPAGGRVTVRVHGSGEKSLAVEDNGPGIPVAERSQVFERFYRGQHGEEGSGLGLSIVSEIALLHDAQVSLESPPSGSGTLVKVLFPSR